MKVLTGVFATAGVLYFLDSTYNDGYYLTILTQKLQYLGWASGFYR